MNKQEGLPGLLGRREVIVVGKSARRAEILMARGIHDVASKVSESNSSADRDVYLHYTALINQPAVRMSPKEGT